METPNYIVRPGYKGGFEKKSFSIPRWKLIPHITIGNHKHNLKRKASRFRDGNVSKRVSKSDKAANLKRKASRFRDGNPRGIKNTTGINSILKRKASRFRDGNCGSGTWAVKHCGALKRKASRFRDGNANAISVSGLGKRFEKKSFSIPRWKLRTRISFG